MFKSYVFDADQQKKLHKKISDFSMRDLVQFSLLNDLNYCLSPQFAIFIIEKMYLRTKRKVVFIDDGEAEALLKMRFNAKHLNCLFADGMQTSMLTLNTTFKIRGVRLYSSLNLLDDVVEFQKSYVKEVASLNPGARFQEYPDDKGAVLKVVTNCADGFNNYITVEQEPLIKLMKLSLDECFVAENLTDIVPEIADIMTYEGRAKETLIQSKIEQIALLLTLRLTLSYYLYNEMTSNQYLVKGCPRFHKQSIKSLKDKSTFQQLKMPKEYKERCLHLRSGFYRQLTHEKYYQNEHKDKPRGSRFVEVKPAVIGKAEAYTQEMQD